MRTQISIHIEEYVCKLPSTNIRAFYVTRYLFCTIEINQTKRVSLKRILPINNFHVIFVDLSLRVVLEHGREDRTRGR